MPNKSSARATKTTVAGYELGLRELWICDTVVVGDRDCYQLLLPCPYCSFACHGSMLNEKLFIGLLRKECL